MIPGGTRQTVGDPSNSGPSELEGYIREADLAKQLNRSVRTLQRLTARRLGPPRIKIGRSVFYRIESVRAWLAQQEQPRKPAASVRSSSQRRKRG
jgi:predicted DNA-binding transcriptional regulator AlpA